MADTLANWRELVDDALAELQRLVLTLDRLEELRLFAASRAEDFAAHWEETCGKPTLRDRMYAEELDRVGALNFADYAAALHDELVKAGDLDPNPHAWEDDRTPGGTKC